MVVNARAIDDRLIKIVEKRNALHETQHHKAQLENELRQLEKEFIDWHGEDISAILKKVYQSHFHNEPMLSPMDYFAQTYRKIGKNINGSTFDVDHSAGVAVSSSFWPGKATKIVFVPNPLRLLLNIDAHTREEVWSINL